uniref:ATP synthase F0 subunit 8 n=1 Tax=Tenebrionoidea sp. 10 KM-2017 TaxID=2219465 RepID=A0A346RIG6_9CUCU|nr:ATP synthase F0 subunit 8 [Tenebrionoidea sp. 10 KM-2017]
MPQMAPLNWVTLMIYFVTLYLAIIIMNYYINMKSHKNIEINNNKMSMKSWKW